MRRFFLTVLAVISIVGMNFGQNIAPKVSEINGNNRFVIVIQGKGTINDKILMPDGTASTKDFNAENLASYPTWIIERLTVDRGENVRPLYYTTFQSVDTRNYLSFGNKGEVMTISEKAYDKFYEKDEAGKFKYSLQDMYNCIYREYIAEDNKHIFLTYHSDRNGASTSHIYKKGWPSKYFKLVLVKL